MNTNICYEHKYTIFFPHNNNGNIVYAPGCNELKQAVVND